jgi:hypothetical protein
MLVFEGFGNKPKMRLTIEPLKRKRKLPYSVPEHCLNRRSIEESMRIIQQTIHMKNSGVLKK